MNNESNNLKKELSEIIAKSDNPNEEIKEILLKKSQKLKDILEQIEELNNLKNLLSYEITTLQEVKNDMHLILDISKELSLYEKKIKESNSFNNWIECFSKKSEDSETKMIGNYNKLYSASIVSIYNDKTKVYRVDIKLILNDIFIKYAKTYNNLSNHINEIKLISDGMIFFEKEDAEKYIEECIEMMDEFFNEKSSSIYKKFKDSNGEVYDSDMFIKYRASYVNGITVLNEEFEYISNAKNIPF